MTLRYFFRVQDNPDSPDYLQPLSVHRFEVTDVTVITERWDAIHGKWVDNPEMIDFTGIGGATDYREVDVAEAERFLKRVGQNEGGPVATQYEIADEGRRQTELDKAQQALYDQDRHEGRNIVARATDSLVAALRTFAESLTGRGGPGSGHFGHTGREGEVGGSAPGEGGRTEPQRVNPAKLTREIRSDPGYFYHATNEDRLFEIAESGELEIHSPDYGTDQSAWPDGSEAPRAYFSRQADIVWQFSPEEGKPVAIRVREGSAKFSEESTGDIFSTTPIPVSVLEYLAEGDEWLPVSNLVSRGGPGSGHHGHAGRPGEVGGSASGEGGSKAKEGWERASQRKNVEVRADLTLDSTRKHLNQLDQLPQPLHDKLVDNGVKWIIGEGSVTSVPEFVNLQGEIPRGWENTGYTWDDVAGVYREADEIVFVGTGLASGASSMILHETGHAISRAFINETLNNPELAEHHARLYDGLNSYLKQGGPGGFVGMDEMFAEGVAEVLHPPSAGSEPMGFDEKYLTWVRNKLTSIGEK